MKYFQPLLMTLAVALSAALGHAVWSKELQGGHDYLPVTRGGEKWRIAYYQGGPWTDYYPTLEATVKGLMDLGWIQRMDLPETDSRDARALWDWLVHHVESDFVEFVGDAFYTADWNDAVRAATKKSIIERLNKENDVDLIIAMGTWAGKDLVNNEHSTPTMVMSSSDPMRAGIIRSNDDSGYDHVHARVDPYRYERQIRVFHNIVGFQRLGVAYEDTVVGRSYAAISLIEKVADEKGFEIVRCFTKDDIPNREKAGASVVECFEELAPQVDAIYVVAQSGVNAETMPRLVDIANRYRLPTFSQQGSDEVKYGFLLSIASDGGFVPVGRFLATTMGKVFNGARPRDLKLLFEEKPTIAINLKTAEMIGLYLFADVLAAADEIYHDVETP